MQRTISRRVFPTAVLLGGTGPCRFVVSHSNDSDAVQRAIAKTLNDEGIPGPSGKAWGSSTIHGNPKRGTGILNNELYNGRLIWNGLRYIKDPETGRRVSRPNPESAWLTKDVPALRIIDQDLWDAVKQRQLAQSASRKASGKPGYWEGARATCSLVAPIAAPAEAATLHRAGFAGGSEP